MFHGAGRFYNLRNPEMKPLIEVCVGRHCCYGLLAPLSGMALRSRLAPWKITLYLMTEPCVHFYVYTYMSMSTYYTYIYHTNYTPACMRSCIQVCICTCLYRKTVTTSKYTDF